MIMTSERLQSLIKQKLQVMGFEKYHAEPFLIPLDQPEKDIVLKNDFLFLNNYLLDIPVTATLQLQSSDNLFITSKIDYETLMDYRYQCFSEQLNITLENYGLSFIPFRLEFIKVTPLQ